MRENLVADLFGDLFFQAAAAQIQLLAQLAAAGSVVLGVFCLVLPHTPPQSTNTASLGDVLGLDALWLLGDRSAISEFLGVPLSKVPTSPEQLADPKQVLINLARRSRKKAVRQDMVPEEEVVPSLVPVLLYFKQARHSDETLGDFCQRKGQADLLAFAEASTAPAPA